MRDAVLFRESAGVDKPAFWFGVFEGQTKIDARSRGWFDLRNDVIAKDGHDRLTGADFHVFAQAQAFLDQGIVKWFEGRLGAGVHSFDVARSGRQVLVGVVIVLATASRAIAKP